MKMDKNVITLAEFKDKCYGKSGTVKRDKLERGSKVFKAKALKLSK
jgi:hypothetical protein